MSRIELNLSTNAKKLYITRRTYWLVIVFDIVIFYLCASGYLLGPGLGAMMKDMPDIFGGLAVFSSAVFVFPILRKGGFGKGETEYFPNKYGKRKLENIIGKYDVYEDYPKVARKIYELSHSGSGDDFRNTYFQYVFELQATSEDFVKVWNDYNYYFQIGNKKVMNDRYFKRLEKYVFIEVYIAHSKNTGGI